MSHQPQRSLKFEYECFVELEIENANLRRELALAREGHSESLERQTATSEVLGVIGRSTTDLQPVLESIVAIAFCALSRFRLTGTDRLPDAWAEMNLGVRFGL